MRSRLQFQKLILLGILLCLAGMLLFGSVQAKPELLQPVEGTNHSGLLNASYPDALMQPSPVLEPTFPPPIKNKYP